MADYATEEEQLEAFKRWWNENGRSLVLGIAIAVMGYFGWQYWQSQLQQSREQASVLFESLMEAAIVQPGTQLGEAELTKVTSIVEELKSDFGSTQYAVDATLLMAKVSSERGDVARAETELRWALSEAKGDAVAPIVNLRLAQVLIAQEKYAEALAALADENPADFTAVYAELRGDVYVAQGERDLAAAQYQKALDTLLAGQNQRRDLIEMKLADINPLDSTLKPLDSTLPAAEKVDG